MEGRNFPRVTQPENIACYYLLSGSVSMPKNISKGDTELQNFLKII